MLYKNRKPADIEIKAHSVVGKTFSPKTVDNTILRTFPYEYPRRAIDVVHTTKEFTCVCPFSGLPDFAEITISYVPDKKCVELKSLKYYLYSYRQTKIFNEHVVNKILEDLVPVVKPLKLTVIGKFTTRGGLETTVTAEYKK